MSMKHEVKIALTTIIALVILFFTIKFMQGINIFDNRDTYYITFKNAKTLAESSPVYADGYNVGIVSNLHYDYDHPERGVTVEISVEHGMRIPNGTTAILDEAMLGGCTLNLLMGTSPLERYAPGDTIPSDDNSGLLDRIGSVMPKLEAAIGRADSLLASLNRLANDTNIVRIIANVQTMTATLDQSSHSLDRLLKNDIPALTSTFDEAGQQVTTLASKFNNLDIEGTLQRVDSSLAHVEQVTATLTTCEGTLGLLINDTTLYGRLNQTTDAATMLLQDLQANPKRYVHFSIFGKKDK